MTTWNAGERGDALRLKLSGVEVRCLEAVGAVPGVTILAAGGANGPGEGVLRQNADQTLTWRAPGSSTYGPDVTVPADGSYVLEDGDDAGAWVRVQVATSFQAAGISDAAVYLQDRFNELGPDDVTASEATAGAVETQTYDLENVGSNDIRSLLVWLDAATPDLEISDDGIAWVSPTTEGGALALADVAPGATVSLHIRRTIAALSSLDADVLNLVHLSWEGH